MAVLTASSVGAQYIDARNSSESITERKGQPVSWYYCLEHKQVEPHDGCPNSERLGPYETKDEAEHALELAAERSAAFDEEEEDD